MLQLSVCKASVLGLVDSGASHNFVGAAFARKLGLKVVRGATLNVRLADG